MTDAERIEKLISASKKPKARRQVIEWMLSRGDSVTKIEQHYANLPAQRAKNAGR